MNTDIAPGTEIVPVVEQVEHVSGLVRLAVERGVDVEILERLVGLQERVTERNARAAFFGAIAQFQDECPPISRSKKAKITTRKGTNYEYTYAPLEEIARTIRPHLQSHGLSYSWTVDGVDRGLIVTCVLRHIDGHEERSSFPVPIDTSAAMSDAQKNGAALTYGRRQSLVAVLGLTTADEDVDGAKQDPQEIQTITEEQAADLSALIEEVEADTSKVLEFAGVGSIGEIAAADYRRITRALEKRRGG